MGLSRLLRRDTTDHASAIRECLFYMESTLILCQDEGTWMHRPKNITYSLSGETLAEDLGILVNAKILYRVGITEANPRSAKMAVTA